MRFATLILALSSILYLSATVYAEESSSSADGTAPAAATDASATPQRGPASAGGGPAKTAPVRRTIQGIYDGGMDDPLPSDERPVESRRRGKDAVGLHLQYYYDPVSSYYQFTSGVSPLTFGSITNTGINGMMAMFSFITKSRFEISFGIDYMFPIAVQGTQIQTGTYQVNNQNLNIMGVRALQVGYQVDFDNITLIPYGGIGVYYGRNVLNLYNYGVTGVGGAQQDTVTYSKLMATFTAGARIEFNFDKSKAFSAGAGVEGFMPANLATQLSQAANLNGGATAELPGYEPNLQNNLEFMNNFGLRLVADIKAQF